MTKQISIQEAVASIYDGSLLALGGNSLQRSPIAFVKELIKQNKKQLSLIKTAGALDVDLLVEAHSVQAVYGGYIGFEMFGLAPSYRKGVQAKEVIVYEHACASVIAALRASIYGVPFQPINGFKGSELPELTGLIRSIQCPFTGIETTVVKALRPTVTIIHTHLADELGNAYIKGALFEDALMVKAAERVIVTAEKIISSKDWKVQPQIQGFLVEAVVLAKKGAAPGACASHYVIDNEAIMSYLQNPTAYVEEVKGSQLHV